MDLMPIDIQVKKPVGIIVTGMNKHTLLVIITHGAKLNSAITLLNTKVLQQGLILCILYYSLSFFTKARNMAWITISFALVTASCIKLYLLLSMRLLLIWSYPYTINTDLPHFSA